MVDTSENLGEAQDDARILALSPEEALSKAIQEAGGPAALARWITAQYGKITAQAICDWRRCPPPRVVQVESAPGVTITRHQLRPDIFPPEQQRLGVAL